MAMLALTYLNAIKSFEGFFGKSAWDYSQYTNGFGTKAKYAGEEINRAEADRRFAAEIDEAGRFVDHFSGGLDEGTRAALTSLTFNAGTGWTKDQLGYAVSRGDLARAKELFVGYNTAGGRLLEGLAQRRLAEAQWIGAPAGVTGGASNDGVCRAAALVSTAATGASSAIEFEAGQSSLASNEQYRLSIVANSAVHSADQQNSNLMFGDLAQEILAKWHRK
jgi:lysozyme